MNYQEWEQEVPETLKADSLWKMSVYRYALFLNDLGWFDVTKLMQDRRTIGLSEQLYEALGSISANIAEGYSRGTGKDRAHFYEYALGSARESRDWYFKSRHILAETVVIHRLKLLEEIIRLLLTMIPQQRGRTIHEEKATYHVEPSLDELFENVPMS
ncbi:MAG: four helix bundle protein [Anaerolineae bacterium CG2_30_58_95]|nr:MAG: four helix bundle protein [Anaerolineae bacterium CG2_30_58_95]